MANYIKKIKLPDINDPFIIRDEEAIHSIADIQGLGLKGAFIFKGAVATVADLPESGNEVGWVYHVIENGSEYVWVIDPKSIVEPHWEEFGHHIIVDHTHDFANAAVVVSGTASESAVSGTATVSGSNADSAVSGTAYVSGTNSESSVSASGSINLPTVEKTSKYVKANGSITDVVVAGNGSAAAITGFENHSTENVITGLETTTINNPTVSSVSVTKIDNFGTAANWGASVSNDGVLSFNWTPNTIASGTHLNASSVSVQEVSVATKETDTIPVITALGKATTVEVLTGVKVETQPTISVSLADGSADDGVYTGDIVAVDSKATDISVSGTAEAQVWTQSAGTISGTAAAQEWIQSEGVISGTAAGQAFSGTGTASGSTGLPKASE